MHYTPAFSGHLCSQTMPMPLNMVLLGTAASPVSQAVSRRLASRNWQGSVCLEKACVHGLANHAQCPQRGQRDTGRRDADLQAHTAAWMPRDAFC